VQLVADDPNALRGGRDGLARRLQLASQPSQRVGLHGIDGYGHLREAMAGAALDCSAALARRIPSCACRWDTLAALEFETDIPGAPATRRLRSVPDSGTRRIAHMASYRRISCTAQDRFWDPAALADRTLDGDEIDHVIAEAVSAKILGDERLRAAEIGNAQGIRRDAKVHRISTSAASTALPTGNQIESEAGRRPRPDLQQFSAACPSDHPTRGNLAVKIVPFFSEEVTSTRPPCAETISFVIKSPKPRFLEPGGFWPSSTSPRVKE
jgi:hypothetical protein